MKTDPYVIDTLMRDLVGHSRSATAFLVYLQLYRHTRGAGRESVAMSHAVLADLIGISKRSVQTAVAHLYRAASHPKAKTARYSGSALHGPDTVGT